MFSNNWDRMFMKYNNGIRRKASSIVKNIVETLIFLTGNHSDTGILYKSAKIRPGRRIINSPKISVVIVEISTRLDITERTSDEKK